MNLAARLEELGMSGAEAAGKAELFAAAERALGSEPQRRWFVPGRIEVLGKHTDYAGGPSLLCAVERGFCIVAAPRSNSVVRVMDVGRNQTAEFPLSADITISGGWGNYVATVVRRLARNFPGISRGADIALASDLPHAAGLSSSSALIVGIFNVLANANRLCERPEFGELGGARENLAAYLGCIENGQTFGKLAGDRGVGTFGGSEDHTAILCCRAGHLSQYRFCPPQFEQEIPLPREWTFAVASSGVRASKTGAARDLYNRAALAAKAALEEWNASAKRSETSLDAAVHRSPEAAAEIRAALSRASRPDFPADDLVRRFDQFVVESQIVPAAAAAFTRGDAATLGEIVARSQDTAERLLGNQVPETIALARSARELGVIAASAFGAGFGGSVWALVRVDDAHPFLAAWRAQYVREFSARARDCEFFLSAAGPALTTL